MLRTSVQIETTLDLGDLGIQPATVDATVNPVTVTRVMAHLPCFSMPIPVTEELSKTANRALCREIERHVEKHGLHDDDDDFKEGA